MPDPAPRASPLLRRRCFLAADHQQRQAGFRLHLLLVGHAVERLQDAKQLADLHSSALLQAAVHRFCEGRLLDRHISRVAAEYGRRRALLLSALRRRMPEGVSWTEPQGGFSLLLTLPAGLEASSLLPLALERGVAFSPGPAFFLDGAGERTMRLAFSSVSGSRIDEGVKRLADAIKAGVALIHQELNLAENLSVAANLFLGREKTIGGPFGLLNRSAQTRAAAEPLGRQRPERVPGLHDVALLARRAARRAGDGQEQHGGHGEGDEHWAQSEHVFAW